MSATDIIRPLALAGLPPFEIARATGIDQSFISSTTGRMRARGEPVPRLRNPRGAGRKPSARKDLPPKGMRIAIDAQAWSWVLADVARETEVSVRDMLSTSKRRVHYLARRKAMLRMKALGMGVTAIGRRMKRDHSTVISACIRGSVANDRSAAVSARAELRDRRQSENIDFVHNGNRMIGSVSRFENGEPAEIFLYVTSKVGTDMEAVARDAAVSASLALQYGCPVSVLRAAMTKEDEERPAGPVAKFLDLIEVAS